MRTSGTHFRRACGREMTRNAIESPKLAVVGQQRSQRVTATTPSGLLFKKAQYASHQTTVGAFRR
jgi:hypothetical protein